MMSKPKAKLIEDKLKRLTYREIAEGLADASVDILFELLDSKSVKVGDTAADFLARKKVAPLIISAILNDQIRTRFGKFRVKSILFGLGRKYPEALTAYLKLLQDPDDEIAHNSLLALVAWGDRRVIPKIKARQASVKSAEDAREFKLACEAIEKSDLSIFNPHVSISKEVWA